MTMEHQLAVRAQIAVALETMCREGNVWLRSAFSNAKVSEISSGMQLRNETLRDVALDCNAFPYVLSLSSIARHFALSRGCR